MNTDLLTTARRRPFISGIPATSLSLLTRTGNYYLQNKIRVDRMARLISANKELISQNGIKDKLIQNLSLAKEQAETGPDNFAAIFNNANELIWSVDSNLNLISFNKAFNRAIELSSGKALTKGDPVLSSQFTEGQLSLYKACYDSALLGETFTITDHFDYPVGFWVEISFHPIRRGVQVMGVACFSRDITERKLAELERDKMTRGMAQVIKDLNSIIQTKGLTNHTWQTISFTELVAGISGSIGPTLDKGNIEIRCDFAAIDELFTLKTYLHSIFYNLISNSIKYRRPDTPAIIEITSRRIGDRTVLTFTDNGLGIDLHKKGGQVFGLYKRFHAHLEGKGMGLFMVKTQVESLGGKISVLSEVNKGTSFTIEFDT